MKMLAASNTLLKSQMSHAVITWSIVTDPRNVGLRFVNFIRDGTDFA